MMKGISANKILGLFLFFLLFVPTSYANYQNQIDALINRLDRNIYMGAMVIDLHTNKILYQRNPSQVFKPASNMKLFSNAAALIALGPDYHFKSKLLTDATVLDHGRLKGSLYFYLPGDPSLREEDIYKMLMQLNSLGIKRIEGNIILVSNNNLINPYPPGHVATDAQYAYGAPIAPLVINNNSLTVTVNPAYKSGIPAIVELANRDINLNINNQVKTASSKAKCGVGFSMDNENNITVNGCINLGHWAVQQNLAIKNPLRYMHDSIKQRLASLDIKLDGDITLGSLPNNSILLAAHNSKSIAQLMADTLKPSDNVYADSLYLHTAALLNGKPINWLQTEPIIKKFLQEQTGINLQTALLVDGSGLSVQNLLSAQQLADLLKFLYERFPLTYEYIAALPVAGRDGTLQKRFRQQSQQSLIRAKTGTMTGVSGLSGYLYTANAHTLAFAILINRKRGVNPKVSGKVVIDKICEFLLQQKPKALHTPRATKPFTHVAYQQKPSYAERLNQYYAKVRQLENAVKQALRGKNVTVIYRGNQLVLEDYNKDVTSVWKVLQNLNRRYAFSVVLNGKAAPNRSSMPHLLWVKESGSKNSRIWTLRDSA